MIRPTALILTLATSFVLGACGGGGGGSKPPATPPSDGGSGPGITQPPAQTQPPVTQPPGAPSPVPSPTPNPLPGTWSAVNTSITLTARPLASDDTINPLHGYHRWRNQESVPQTNPALDAYQRYTWKNLESALGVYDFSTVIADIQTAKASGRKFAFRVRMMVGYDDGQVYIPDYLVGHASCAHGCGWWADYDATDPDLTFVPDWNDAFLLARASLLLQALAGALAPYADDIAWIDVGMYGQYGEFTLSSSIDYATAPPGIVAVTNSSKRAIATMHFNAFPARQHVMFALYGNYDTLLYGLTEQTITTRPVGLRIDCLGKASFMNQWTNRPAEYALIRDRWQSAPFVAEFCPYTAVRPVGTHSPSDAVAQIAQFHISSISNGNLGVPWSDFTASEQSDLLMLGRSAGYRYAPEQAATTLDGDGLLSVSILIRNHGNAPSYESWNVDLELLDSTGATAWSQSLPGNLGLSTGAESSQYFGATATLPASLPAGTYTLTVIARSAHTPQQRKPLIWAIQEVAASGAATLATLHKN